MHCLLRYSSGTKTWLSIFYRFEHLLVFDVLLSGWLHIEHIKMGTKPRFTEQIAKAAALQYQTDMMS